MCAAGTNLHNKRLPSETEHVQRVPSMDAAQQLKLREKQQRFFEEVFQHDVDVYLSSAHLQIDYKRPPLGSISSMEVNVDMLEQTDLLDLSDPEALDAFFSASGEEGILSSPLPAFPPLAAGSEDGEGLLKDGISLLIPDKARMSSTSSNSTFDSQDTNEDGAETPTVQSDDEDEHIDESLVLSKTSPAKHEEKEKLAL